jgi:hypothetical protein
MNLATVITRVRAQASTFSNWVGGAAEFTRALETSEALTLPHAFVVLVSETADGSAIDEEIAVVVAVDARGDERGQTGAQSLEALRDELLTALHGWSPSSDHRPMRYLGADYVTASRHAVFYQYNFASIRETEALFRFTISLVARVQVGSTSATVLTNWATAIETAISGISRLSGDYAGDELAEGLAKGAKGYRLQGIGSGSEGDSNDRRIQLAGRVTVYYRLAVDEAERTFTEGNMQTWVTSLLSKSMWKVTGVDQIIEDPSLDYPSDVVRT